MHTLGRVHVWIVHLRCVSHFGFGGWVYDRPFFHQVLDHQSGADQVADLVWDDHFGDSDQLVVVFYFVFVLAEGIFFLRGCLLLSFRFRFVSIRVESGGVDLSFVSLLGRGVLGITFTT